MDQMGVLPSLEVLPFFVSFGDFFDMPDNSKVSPKSFTSYGEIVRGLLTKELVVGILPWEVFVLEVLSKPGQRDQWQVPLFLNPCPTELVLREPVHRIFFPRSGVSTRKFPSHITLGVESENSLTKLQFAEWLTQWPGAKSIRIDHKVLPMNLIVKALEAETIDAIIAPSPWGLREDEAGVGIIDLSFRPGRFTQKLALVCQRQFMDKGRSGISELTQCVSSAREYLRNPASFGRAVEEMSRSGSLNLSNSLLERAGGLHQFASLDQDLPTNCRNLTAELVRLADIGVLPSQVSPSEQTARLLLPS